MKVPLVAASFFVGIDAVERCPLFAEKGWKLVRRTTDDAFSKGDLMAGTMVSGITHQLMKDWDSIGPIRDNHRLNNRFRTNTEFDKRFFVIQSEKITKIFYP